MTTVLRVGMGDSYGIRATVLASADFDPSAPTGGTFKVTKTDGTTVNWTGVIASQSSTAIELTYAFNASGADLDQIGTWTFWIQWTVPGETPGPRTEVDSFAVKAASTP